MNGASQSRLVAQSRLRRMRDEEMDKHWVYIGCLEQSKDCLGKVEAQAHGEQDAAR